MAGHMECLYTSLPSATCTAYDLPCDQNWSISSVLAGCRTPPIISPLSHAIHKHNWETALKIGDEVSKAETHILVLFISASFNSIPRPGYLFQFRRFVIRLQTFNEANTSRKHPTHHTKPRKILRLEAYCFGYETEEFHPDLFTCESQSGLSAWHVDDILENRAWGCVMLWCGAWCFVMWHWHSWLPCQIAPSSRLQHLPTYKKVGGHCYSSFNSPHVACYGHS